MGNQHVIEMKGINKQFGSITALKNVDFFLPTGEICGLLGGNGAGKTTLMNILYGLYRQDAGQVYMDGKLINIQSPKDSLAHGIGMVHQHFLQIVNYSVIENIVLGADVKHPFTSNLAPEKQKINELCTRFGLELDPEATIGSLPVGTRQKVEILKALFRGIKVLILDEPTTSLTPQEVDSLFQSLKVMVKEGLSIVFITHKLREVLSVCNSISVLREGRNVISLDRKSAAEEELVKAMVGEKLDVKKSIIFSKGKYQTVNPKYRDAPIFNTSNLSYINSDKVKVLKDISIDLYMNEVLGIAGVAGNGQHELVEVIMNIQQPTSGHIRFSGEEFTGKPTRLIWENGLVYIPEDRLDDGFLPKASVAHNLILGFHNTSAYSRKGFLNWKSVFSKSRQMIEEYNIKTAGPDEMGSNLSGGNIQRVMIARVFSQNSRMLVAHNPTRGLDIPSTDFVYQKILEKKKEGMSTLLITEDLDELMLICDRIAILYKGEIVGVLAKKEFEKYRIGRLMSGFRDVDSKTKREG